MRWADLDQLNHVYNVVYVDYAMAARAQLVEDGHLEPDLPIRQVRVEFVRPLLLSSKPVLVRSSLDGDTLTHEIRSPSGSALFSTVVVEHGTPQPADDARGLPLEMQVRRSDLGPDGTVALVRLFEILQESRIQTLGRLLLDHSPGLFVIGRVELDLGEPLPWRRDPYPVQAHIAHVGRSSFRSTTRIDGGRYGSATATMVGYDMANQTSRRLNDGEREALTAALLPADA